MLNILVIFSFHKLSAERWRRHILVIKDNSMHDKSFSFQFHVGKYERQLSMTQWRIENYLILKNYGVLRSLRYQMSY